jgi:hypothetical protein
MGYAALTITSTGKLTLSGRLADGVAFTTSTFVGPQGQVLVHQASTTQDTILGSLSIEEGLVDNDIAGMLSWSRKPQSAAQRLYKTGFGPVDLTAAGGSYVAPATYDIVMDLAEQADNARVVFTGADLGSISPDIMVQIKPGGTVLLPTFNHQKTTLKVVPATGGFSGTFVTAGRTTTYQGLLVRHAGSWNSTGYFLFDQPAAGPTPAAMISGLVELKANP